MFKRIVAIAFITICAMVAWFVLYGAMEVRTRTMDRSNTDKVGGLWGEAQTQAAPGGTLKWEKPRPMTNAERLAHKQKKQDEENERAKADGDQSRVMVTSLEEAKKRKLKNYAVIPAEEFMTADVDTTDLALDGSDIKVKLDLDHRKKGLMWFSTYKVAFSAEYRVKNPREEPAKVTMTFPFPCKGAVYDNMKVEVVSGATALETSNNLDSLTAFFKVEPHKDAVVRFAYQSRGLDQWLYRFGSGSREVKNFKLVMTTDFIDIDFPAQSLSPDDKKELPGGAGWDLTWKKESLVSAVQIGMVMPQKLNPGPLAASMSLHAPVSLLFYFFLIFLLQTIRGIKLHPMNYFFLACGFFAFNLLFSYLVDHLDLRLSFAIATGVSVFLVVSYLKLAVGARFAIVDAGLSQLVYQVLFAFAHFFVGFTGLAVTVIAIVTLAVVMRITAKIDWEEKFKDSGNGKKRNRAVAPPPFPDPAPASQGEAI